MHVSVAWRRRASTKLFGCCAFWATAPEQTPMPMTPMPSSRSSRHCRSNWIRRESDSLKTGDRDEIGSLFRKRRRRTPFRIRTSRCLCRTAHIFEPSLMQIRPIRPSICIYCGMASRRNSYALRNTTRSTAPATNFAWSAAKSV